MILISSTSFPRAREHNVKVEEFADLSVAIWEAAGGAGEHAGWVIDVRLQSTPLSLVTSPGSDPLVGNPIYLQFSSGV